LKEWVVCEDAVVSCTRDLDRVDVIVVVPKLDLGCEGNWFVVLEDCFNFKPRNSEKHKKLLLALSYTKVSPFREVQFYRQIAHIVRHGVLKCQILISIVDDSKLAASFYI